MSINVQLSDKAQPLHWQSLNSFTASTTLSEKIWRVVNNLLFVAAGLGLYAIVS